MRISEDKETKDEGEITTYPYGSKVSFIKYFYRKNILSSIQDLKQMYKEFIKKWLTLMILQEKTYKAQSR